MKECAIKAATMDQFDGIWEVIEKINNRRKSHYGSLAVQDCMTSQDLAIAIRKRDRQIFYIQQGEKIVGILSFYLQEADYIFFASEYIYIDYLYTTERKYMYLKQLFNVVKQYARNKEVSIICIDAYMKEDIPPKYLELGFQKYRNRIARTLSGSSI